MVMAEIINWLRETKKYAVFGSIASKHSQGIIHIRFFSTQREAEQGVFDYFRYFETVHRKNVEKNRNVFHEPTGWPESLDLDASMTLEQIINHDYFAQEHGELEKSDFYLSDIFLDDPTERKKQFQLLGSICHDICLTEDPKEKTTEHWTWAGEDYERAFLVRLL